MPRRRVKNRALQAVGEDSNMAQADILRNLGGLAGLGASLAADQGLTEEPEFAGTAQDVEELDVMDFPRTPSNPQEFDQGLPPGLEMLADLAQSEGREDALDAVSETNPPDVQELAREPSFTERMAEDMGEDDILPGMWSAAPIWNALKDWASSEKSKEVSESNASLFEDNRLREEAQQQGMTLPEYKQKQADEYGQDQKMWEEQISQAVQEPYTRAVYGATDTVMQTPALRKQVESIGVEITPEMEDMTKKMEMAISEMNEEELRAQGVWDDQIDEIRERIENNQATDMDKFFVGLALTMPLIIGGVFGAEAGFGALAGSAGNLLSVYEGRDKAIREDEESVRELEKLKTGSKLQQQKLEIEQAKIPGQVKKAVGSPPLEHLEGMEMVRYTDAEGNTVSEGVKLKPGLVATLDMVDDKDAKKEMRKEASELNGVRTAVDKLGTNSRRILEITEQIDDPGFLKNVFQGWAKGKKPTLVAKFGKPIILDGREVNSAVTLVQTLEDTLEARRQAMKIKNFGPQLFDHFERILTNPYGEFTTPQDLVDQTLRLYTDTRDQMLQDAENRGFLREPLLDEFRDRDYQMYQRLNLGEGVDREQENKERRRKKMVDLPDA